MSPAQDDTDALLAFALARQAQRRRRQRLLRRARAPAPDGPSRAAVPQVSPSQRIGYAAETEALHWLCAAGLQLVARNVACRHGELDLILREGAALVFVEVRHRHDARHGGALASVDAAKQRRLVRSAHWFLAHVWRAPAPLCRFDVLARDGTGWQWVRGAFVTARDG